MSFATRSIVEEAEVDQIINRHKGRIQKHRQFIDGDAAEQYISPTLDVDPSKWKERQEPVSKTYLRQEASAPAHHTPRSRYSAVPNSPRSQTGTVDTIHREPSTFAGNSFVSRDSVVERPPLPAESRYVTDSPTRMHERSKAWLSAKEQKLMRSADEVYNEQYAECTFQPRTATYEYEIAHQATHYSTLAGAANSGGVIDVGEATYIERQRIARERKAEAERKLVPDTSKWRNATTKPKEFALNRRDSFIPALKKPCFSPPNRGAKNGQTLPSSEPTTAVKPEGAAQRSESNVTTPRGGGASTSRTVSEKHNFSKQQGKGNGSTVLNDSIVSYASSKATTTNVSTSSPMRTEVTTGDGGINAAALKRILLEKDATIEELRNQLDLSRRELEVARNTIRELSLA